MLKSVGRVRERCGRRAGEVQERCGEVQGGCRGVGGMQTLTSSVIIVVSIETLNS
jgi:hypothetical protein